MEKKTGKCVIETLESFAEARPHSPWVGGFKVQSQPKRSLIENHWRSWKNKEVCIFGRRGGLMIYNWCTGVRKHQRGVLKGISSVLWLPGVVESYGLLAGTRSRSLWWWSSSQLSQAVPIKSCLLPPKPHCIIQSEASFQCSNYLISWWLRMIWASHQSLYL